MTHGMTHASVIVCVTELLTVMVYIYRSYIKPWAIGKSEL